MGIKMNSLDKQVDGSHYKSKRDAELDGVIRFMLVVTGLVFAGSFVWYFYTLFNSINLTGIK